MDRSEALALALVLLGRYLDAAATIFSVGSGLGFEANPFMLPWVSRPLALLALQNATTNALVVALIVAIVGLLAWGIYETTIDARAEEGEAQEGGQGGGSG